MAVPALFLQDAQLGEPLHDEVVVVHPPGATCVTVGQARAPLDAEARPAAGSNRVRRGHLRHRAIVDVAVVGLHIAQRRQQVARRGRVVVAQQRDGLHVHGAEATFAVFRPAHGRIATSSLAARRGRQVVAEGVPVQVEGEIADRALRQVAPVQHERAGDHVRLRIETCFDRVVGVARRRGRERRQAALVERGQRQGLPGRLRVGPVARRAGRTEQRQQQRLEDAPARAHGRGLVVVSSAASARRRSLARSSARTTRVASLSNNAGSRSSTAWASPGKGHGA